MQLNEMSTLGQSKVLSFSFWFQSGEMKKRDGSKDEFQWSEMFPGLFQDFMDGYIKPEGSSY